MANLFGDSDALVFASMVKASGTTRLTVTPGVVIAMAMTWLKWS